MIRDLVKMGKREVEFIWHENKILDCIFMHQVYGFILDDKKRVVLVRDKDELRFTLPGGSIEPSESPIEAMIRECMEEAQFELKNIKLLGSLEVFDPESKNPDLRHHQEIRFFARAAEVKPFVPEKDGFETVERIFVAPEDLPEHVHWMKDSFTGKAQYSLFLSEGNINI